MKIFPFDLDHRLWMGDDIKVHNLETLKAFEPVRDEYRRVLKLK